jgi:hypothetical protein
MGATTARGAFPYPTGPDNWKQIRTAIQSLAQKIADTSALYVESTAATRPAVGVTGRFHRATDTGAVSLDTGSAWIAVPSAAAASGFAQAAHGAIGARPAASAAMADSFFLITDATGGGVIGTLYYCDGTTWTAYSSKALADAAYVVRAEAQGARVDTVEATTATAYTDLATPGPAVTVVVGASGKVKVTLGCAAYNSLTSTYSGMSVALSGANVFAANDSNIVAVISPLTSTGPDGSKSYILTGLAPGSTTFTAKYRVGGGTGTFSRRTIDVIPL